jgi:hypothetical protein
MNVLWIEDFGGVLQADSPTVCSLFNGLISKNILDKHWSPETDLLENPGKLKEFFERHSETHTLTLLRHYGDFLKLSRSGNLVGDYDLVAIDINLSRGVPKDVPLPDGYSNSEDFHKEAGFYIYNQLIRLGFPDDHICFLTGEIDSTFEHFAEHCKNALMPRPKAFGKDDAGMNDFRDWLKERRKSDYATLRRGVIEGCKMLRAQIGQNPDVIQFNKFIGNESYQVSPESMDDYLFSLMLFLPPQHPATEEDMMHRLRLFARAIAHEWESKVDPHQGGDRVLSSLGWVMKETRNCLAHSQALNHLVPQDAAYLFLVNMRAMFALPQEPARFEAILLSLFEQIPLPKADKIVSDLKGSHSRLLDTFNRGGGEKASRNFHELVSRADKLNIRSNIDYVALLYQILWHRLAQQGKADDAAGYRCDARLQAFGGEGGFLNKLMKSIYSRSFLSRSSL